MMKYVLLISIMVEACDRSLAQVSSVQKTLRPGSPTDVSNGPGSNDGPPVAGNLDAGLWMCSTVCPKTISVSNLEGQTKVSRFSLSVGGQSSTGQPGPVEKPMNGIVLNFNDLEKTEVQNFGVLSLAQNSQAVGNDQKLVAERVNFPEGIDNEAYEQPHITRSGGVLTIELEDDDAEDVILRFNSCHIAERKAEYRVEGKPTISIFLLDVVYQVNADPGNKAGPSSFSVAYDIM